MNKYIVFISSIIIFIGLSACEKMLNPVDQNFRTTEDIYGDPAFAEGLLLTAYSGINSPYSFSEMATDDAVSNQLNNGYRRLSEGQLSSQYNPNNQWDKYKQIFHVNEFFHVVDEVNWHPDTTINILTRERLKGEAYGLRALLHFYVLQAHAGKVDGELMGVPYFNSHLEADDDFNQPRLSYQATLDYIMADLDSAIAILPMDYGDAPSARYKMYDVNKYQVPFGTRYTLRMSARIAKGIKARVALSAASPAFLGNGNGFDKHYATMATTTAIGLLKNVGVGALNSKDAYEFYNSDIDVDNPDIIWRASTALSSQQEADNFPPSSEFNGKGRTNPSKSFVEAFPMKDGRPIQESTSYDANNPYKNRDPRLSAYVAFNEGVIGGKIVNILSGSINGVDDTPERSTRTGYYLKKLLRPDVVIHTNKANTDQKQIRVYMRYTEMLLIAAEAANEIGGPHWDVFTSSVNPDPSVFTPSTIIGFVRNRAFGIGKDKYFDPSKSYTKDEMREIIRNERRIELSFEGFRFWDLRRWNTAIEDLNVTIQGDLFTPGETEPYQSFEVTKLNFTSVYMPIPNAEILKFDQLKQNDGY